MRCRTIIAILGLLAEVACVHNHSQPAPQPIALAVASPALAPQSCEPPVQAMVPLGQTPAPTTDGELAVDEVRGDDRLGILGDAQFTWLRDGEVLVSVSTRGVQMWSATNGALVNTIAFPQGVERIGSVVASPDGQWLAVGAALSRVVRSGEPQEVIFALQTSGDGAIQRLDAAAGTGLRFDPDSRTLVNASHRWDLVAGTDTHIEAPNFGAETMRAAGANRSILFAKSNNPAIALLTPELRDDASKQLLHQFPPIESSIGAALSGDGKHFAHLHAGVLSVYSTDTFVRETMIPNVGRAQWVHLSYDGRRAVTEVLQCLSLHGGDARETSRCPPALLTIWELSRREVLYQSPDGSGFGWTFTPDGEYLTGTSSRLVDSIIRIRDGKSLSFGSRIFAISPASRRVLYAADNGYALAPLERDVPVPALERSPKILARSADGKWMVAQEANRRRVQIFGATSCHALPNVVAAYGDKPRSALEERASGLVFSADSSSLFVTSQSGSDGVRFRAYETQSGAGRWAIQSDPQQSGSVAVLPLANQVLFQGVRHPELRRFDATTGAELPSGEMPRVGYVVSSAGPVRDVRSHEGDRSADLHAPIANRSGSRLAMSDYLGDDCVFSFWDPRKPRDVDDRHLGCTSTVKALSPDGRWIATSAPSGRVLLIGFHADTTRAIERMHVGKVQAIVYSPTGARLVVADDTGSIVVADPSKGTVTGHAQLPFDYAEQLWISPDGATLIADTARGMRVRFKLAIR
jgi:WD40 repeat protein